MGYASQHTRKKWCFISLITTLTGAEIACWLERHTRDWKVASLHPGRSSGRMFYSRVNFVCGLLFGVRSTPVLLQWHIKDPGHSAKSAGGRLYLNTHTPLTQQSPSELTMLSPGIVWEPIRKRAHKQLTRKHLVTVVSACWATVEGSWPKEWN